MRCLEEPATSRLPPSPHRGEGARRADEGAIDANGQNKEIAPQKAAPICDALTSLLTATHPHPASLGTPSGRICFFSAAILKIAFGAP